MPLPAFDELHQRADRVRSAVPVAVAGAADRTVLEALRAACDRGWVTPLLVGAEEAVRRSAHESGVALHGFQLIDSADAARTAVELVRDGQAALLMKGQIATPALMHAILDPAAGLRTGRVVCQVVLMEICRDRRRFLLADTGICIAPTLEQQLDILRSTVEIAAKLGLVQPQVAAMAASEAVVDAMPETVAAREIQRRGQAGELGACVVRGPLSFDLAYDAAAGTKKQVGGGVADIMLFPNLLAANLTVKAIMYTADCRFGGVLWGARCPVVFMSRADSTATRLNSLALALALTS